MLRFAFAPTNDMNVEDLRVALLNFIVAQQHKEDLIVRVEDTETRENIEGKDKEFLDLLDLFGVRYTQTLHQTQHFRFHSAMALQLLHEKKAFSCFCSPEWIQGKIDEAKAANKPYLYDDACANLPAELVIDNINPFTVRIHRPTKDITITDKAQGKLTFTTDTIDSFMILKQDKTPMPDFASAVDDMLSDISLVIKSQEDQQSTPKQIYVREALQYDKKVEYAHLPSLTNSTQSVKALLEEGFLPEAISNYLISLVFKVPKEIFTLQEAIEFFSLEKLSKSSTNFDLEALKEINRAHLTMLDNKELSRYVGFADEEIGALAKLYLKEVATTKELRTKLAPVFETKTIPEQYKKNTLALSKVIKEAPYFENYADFKEHLIKELEIEAKEFESSLRLLLTGEAEGPDLEAIYAHLKNYIQEIVK